MTNAQHAAAAEKLDGILHALLGRRGITHALIHAETGDGSFRWTGAAGDADARGTPMTAGTPFHIASIDKMLTATAILRLHERRRVDLDERIVAYLPGKQVARIHVLDGVDRSAQITVRQLLSHTSGLPDCFEDAPKGGRSLMERLFVEGDRSWTLEELLAITRGLRPHFPPQPVAAPRPKVRYCNTNYQLLDAIVEAVDGRPVDRLLEESVFRPLGMRHTWFLGRGRSPPDTPGVAGLWFGDAMLDLPQALACFPSVYSTVADLVAFRRAIATGKAFDDPATARMMDACWNRFGLPLDRAALRNPGWPIEYGLGMMRFRLPRLFTMGWPMPALTGHTGSTGSWLFHAPELDLYLAGTVDQATAGAVPFRTAPKILRMLQVMLS